ncbi:PREDICTED: uncharacterized protein LOC18591711 isoform X2 [Theobroma cacao]|uniref:Uncharacterized protein LOC18591711 isoform X2 n=1 Tax=Theobroma cacao TaxID=3641 RepID=A0AB32WTR6_THECC|nr:PREDICTED: uncharacterized protein LOC18591711 isoform X2 [Theobroma cacao]
MEMDPLPPQSCTLSTVQRIAKNPRHFSIVYLFIVILETVFSGCQRHVIHERKEAKSNLLRAEGRRHKLDILYLDRAKQISESSSKKSWVKSVLAMCFIIMLFAGNAIAENMEDGTKILLQQILLYVFSGALF